MTVPEIFRTCAFSDSRLCKCHSVQIFMQCTAGCCQQESLEVAFALATEQSTSLSMIEKVMPALQRFCVFKNIMAINPERNLI